LQIARGLRDSGDAVEVSHPVSLLAQAYRRERASDVPRGTP
jgi:Fe-S oxidoreductase